MGLVLVVIFVVEVMAIPFAVLQCCLSLDISLRRQSKKEHQNTDHHLKVVAQKEPQDEVSRKKRTPLLFLM